MTITAGAPRLRVRTMDGRELRFSQEFHIGRERDCEVWIQGAHVSRRHAVVCFANGHWTLRDLNSGAGVFVSGRRVDRVQVDRPVTVGLGARGPYVTLDVETTASQGPDARGETRLLERVAERYLDPRADHGQVGKRTRVLIRTFQRVRKQQERRYRWILAAVAVAAVCAAAYAFYAHREMRRQQAFAEELFYRMKSLDVSIASLERALAASGSTRGQDQIRRYTEERRQMERDYERFLSDLGVYGGRATEQERLILQVTRMFGECELAAPPEYVREVTRYIRQWQSSGRFARSIKLANDLGYTRRIAEEFLAQSLPPQFFYLALQESDFDAFASGPPTRMGIAKGMWQFIPSTGSQYGLKIGPFAGLRRPDPDDDRHDWEKATRAAAAYIKDIYATDAQASGLLVMASYNWGEHRVIRLLRTMPENPRERNFWQVLERYPDRLVKETYDYVFSIVSAAVIGENPRLFGFPFDSPLGFLDEQPAQNPPSR